MAYLHTYLIFISQSR